MKKFWTQVIILLVVTFGSLYYTFNPDLNLVSLGKTTSTLRVGQATIKVEVAQTEQDRRTGLSNRDSLDPGVGMLFVFPDTKIHQFWMKDMRFPLDFIFIRDNVIVDILKNVPNPDLNTASSELSIYQPVVPINMLLEVNAGFTERNMVKVGQSIGLLN